MSSSGEEDVAPVNKTTLAAPDPAAEPSKSSATAVSPTPLVSETSSNHAAAPTATPSDFTPSNAAAEPPESQGPSAASGGSPTTSTTASPPTSTSTDATQGPTTTSSATGGPSGGTGKDDKDSDSEGDGAEEILEESPCKRWSKRREQVKQRDVPGIDGAYLAMDNETGNEVVWNEVQFSERKNFRAQEEKINLVFDNLMRLVHTNLVKFHKYWTDAKSEKPRIIFITEYMSAGCMARFLQRTRKSGNNLSPKAWKKWTTQILSALNYLHSCTPPIVHGNITCDTVFIQGNGLIKIGCVAPTAIHHHVKTFRENIKNMHYIAPEFDLSTTEADIYSFGICALEMAAPGGLANCCCSTPANGMAVPVENKEKLSNASENTHITQEMIQKGLEMLEDSMQKSFIAACLETDPKNRPTAQQLLLHGVLFEVQSLKLLAAHRFVDSGAYENFVEDDLRVQDTHAIAATSKFREMAYNDVPGFQADIDKFLEDVGQGIYPLTAFAPLAHPPPLKLTTDNSCSGLVDSSTTGSTTTKTAPNTETLTTSVTVPNIAGSSASEASASTVIGAPKPKSDGSTDQANGLSGSAPANGAVANGIQADFAAATSAASSSQGAPTSPPGESRSVVEMKAELNPDNMTLTLLFQLDDDMNRQLTTDIQENDTAEALVEELLLHGFISGGDSEKICGVLTTVLLGGSPPSSIHNGETEELPEDGESQSNVNAEDEKTPMAEEKRTPSPAAPAPSESQDVIEPQENHTDTKS
ncbi:hypothetical protein L596_007733 [Steinernema carpocapsae]|uniref:Protein kinase domain-containing protein n=1 Tax=Steinernema carpocapsae TaxID=34508 RepID=A0A4U5PA93_STECR|nr:hypothetical protein L596_007733 [Steinernema carpocapsae]